MKPTDHSTVYIIAVVLFTIALVAALLIQAYNQRARDQARARFTVRASKSGYAVHWDGDIVTVNAPNGATVTQLDSNDPAYVHLLDSVELPYLKEPEA